MFEVLISKPLLLFYILLYNTIGTVVEVNMELNLSVGLKYKEEKTVTMDDTAKVFGSGATEVFATPMMIGLMEAASMNAVKGFLPKGCSTVGTLVNVKHMSATKVGKKVWAEAELMEIDRKRLVFKVTAYDEDKKIGEGTHERFVIDDEKFMSKI
jgi:predicted thioesterase